MKKEIIAICLMQLVVLNSYAQEKEIDASGYATQQHIKDEKNYKIGEIKTSYVGDTILERNAFKEIVYPRKLVQPNIDVNISLRDGFGFSEVDRAALKSDRFYEIENSLWKNNEKYFVINPYRSNFSLLDKTVTNKSSIEILINTNGSFAQYIKWAGSVLKVDGIYNWKISPNPSDIVFTFSDFIEVDKKSYLSQNIVFIGLKNNQIKFKYLEKKYRDNNLVSADPIEFSVENNSVIQVRNYKIQVLNITENEITYKVISD